MNSFFDKNKLSPIHAFHQTPGDYPSSPKPKIDPNYSEYVTNPSPVAGNIAGEFKGSEIGLLSCTESLGFESSEEMMSSLDEVSSRNSKKSLSLSVSTSSTSSFCSRIIPFCCSPSSGGKYMRRERMKMKTKADLPPPLTSLSENGRRNFTLKSVRKDGRLEIVGVMIERPEILCASRSNGRLRLHLVQTSVRNDDDENDGDEEDEVVEEEEVAVAEAEEEVEVEVEAEEGGGEVEGDQWRVVTAAAARRCYHMREVQVWGQQHRYVTTM
ncbi:hypothetical protein RND81_09G224300 [Saponaria officinalis]|uniref:FAF domain-containing protein n=1 Tax=Saponaria officinalis TaxID=3572 RepID=A0AAW1IP56_SAPOF